MVDKFGEACLCPLKVGKRHHRRGERSITTEEHRELVDEAANGGLGALLSVIDFGGKEVNADLQLIAEITHLFQFGFKVFPLGMGEDKIEDSDTPLNVFEFVFPAVAKVLPADLAVPLSGEE